VISREEMQQKIHAAVDSRRDDDTVIIARTGARAAHSLDEALDRGAAYAEAGADVLFIEGLRADELRSAGKSTPGTPKLANLVESWPPLVLCGLQQPGVWTVENCFPGR
jgi:2-methylisocitrate lyase-like PEP mutase family enzyme